MPFDLPQSPYHEALGLYYFNILGMLGAWNLYQIANLPLEYLEQSGTFEICF